MAGKLAAYEDRTDVTALPYGVNTPAGFLSSYSIMLPLAFKDIANPDPQDWAETVWKGACSAIFVCGIFEIMGILFGNFFRRNLSHAALYAPITAVGFVYLSFIPIIDFAREPFIGILPFAMCFLGFFANGGHGVYPTSITSVTMLVIGIVMKWCNAGKFNPPRDEMADQVEKNWNDYAGKNSMGAFITLEGMENVSDSVSIVLPVALQSFIETMENVDLAAALGDSYNVREAMLADGLGTCVGALFGATLPTTVYIGHIRHKRLGATAGYSIANGVVYFVLLMSGIFPTIYAIVDGVSVGMILLFVGLIVVQTSFERSAARHYPALFIGLMFVIADPWFFDLFPAGSSSFSQPATRSLNRYYGLGNMMPGGGILVSLFLTQIICDMIDLRFIRGATYSVLCCILSEFGFMHGNNPVKEEGSCVREDSICVSGTVDAATERGQVLAAYIDGGSYKQLATYPPPLFGVTTGNVDANNSYGLNESWRFAAMYAVLALFLLAHLPFQYKGLIAKPIMDNGVVHEETALQAAQHFKKAVAEEEGKTRTADPDGPVATAVA
uniref:SLC26A/SulP transporter domain-containing protein n=3 Tax=Chrysotila carterae TaxID=13221 RepID=A0A7S4F4P7_CHRCT